MIIVQETFVCKPGNASKLVKKFKEAMSGMNEVVRFMTDLTGDFNRVVIVSQYESLGAYEQNFEKFMKNAKEMKKMQQVMEGYHDMYLTGSREIFQVWQ